MKEISIKQFRCSNSLGYIILPNKLPNNDKKVTEESNYEVGSCNQKIFRMMYGKDISEVETKYAHKDKQPELYNAYKTSMGIRKRV